MNKIKNPVIIRNEITEEAKKIWKAVDKAADKAPDWVKRRMSEMPIGRKTYMKCANCFSEFRPVKDSWQWIELVWPHDVAFCSCQCAADYFGEQAAQIKEMKNLQDCLKGADAE